MTVTANFVQFLAPNGRQRAAAIDVPDELSGKLDTIRTMGLRLTVERLSTGQVSIAIEDPEHGDYTGALTSNGPPLPAAVEAMVSGFDLEAFKIWRCLKAKSEEEPDAGTE